MLTDGIILDVDGTLWDSTDVVAESWKKVIDALQMKSDIDVSAENLKKHFGKTMEVIADEVFPEETKERRKEMMALCCKTENSDLREIDADLLYPGVADTIRELSKKVKLFIVSNCQKGYIEVLVDKYNFHPYITDTECYGNNGLNKDENIRLLVERNNLKYPVYVGDTEGDMLACKSAGVPFIFATYGFGKTDEYIAKIDSFTELLNIEKLIELR